MPLKWNQHERQRRSAPSPTRPGLARVATSSCASRASPTCVGGGLGRGVVVIDRDVSANCYPHPQPLPSRLRACPLPANINLISPGRPGLIGEGSAPVSRRASSSITTAPASPGRARTAPAGCARRWRRRSRWRWPPRPGGSTARRRRSERPPDGRSTPRRSFPASP